MDRSGDLFSDRIPWTWILVAAGALIYIPFIGGVHLFDWDEINFAEISREMMMTGDYLSVQVDYKPFFEKPPFFFWLQSLSMHVFGINEFAARLPNALVGILVLLLLYKLGSHWIDKRFGILWALSYLGSLLPTLYHKSGIIDPWFNLFIFGSLAAWFEGSRNNQGYNWFLISGLLSGLAILTKGPVGPLLVGFTVLCMRLFSQKKQYLRFSSILLFIAGCIVVAGLWFGMEWLAHGPVFITAFLKYQMELLSHSVAGHKGFPGYHFVIALFGIFPASIFALAAFRKKLINENDKTWELRQLMIILTFIVLAIFTIVKSKIVHYSSLAYYPVTFLSAWTILQLFNNTIRWKTWHSITGAFVAVIIGFALFALPLAGLNMEKLIARLNSDPFTKASLNGEVHWGYMGFLPGLLFLLIITVAYAFFKKLKFQYSLISLFVGIAILVNVILICFIGKIELYTQRAAIDFYKSKEGQDVEIETLGFHSYAPFFYAKKPLPSGNIADKKTYYVARAGKKNILQERPDLKLLYEKNGFIFLEK